jgi:uncharacterized protein (DUF1778 family)
MQKAAKRSVSAGPTKPRGKTINLRISDSQRHLIDRAAQALGRTRSDFMLNAAAREAEAILLDRRYFQLSGDKFTAFVAALDCSPAQNEKLRRLRSTKAPWER